ncbi:MAG: hypothetical protein OHM56_01555 [Spiroplasma phoeniceum]|nr:MAG: hypothetical protein OHM57_00990 [Spiroplasma phoeniceum]UZQ32675.1 MAG: hypothetical protein OHM56_01555 [Spiroplasma phoeniceum]
MKKILFSIEASTLIGIITTSLVACNTQQYSEDKLSKLKEENKINTKDGVLEWITPQEKPFNKVDNRYYFVISRVNKDDDWHISKFENNIPLSDNEKRTVDSWNGRVLNLKNKGFGKVNLQLIGDGWVYWWKTKDDYFKSVYRWNGDEQKLPDLIIYENGNVKVNN